MLSSDPIVLQAGSSEKNYWRDLYLYRELFYILAWRDISVRYKQTAIGVAWAVVRPFLMMVILTVLFGRLADMPSVGTAPYALLVMCGMLPWTLFSTSLGDASGSLIANSNLITKVYFPRLIVPTAAVMTAFVDFVIGLVMLFMMMFYYRFVPGWQILLLPFFSILAFSASLGPGLYATALNVKYRDFRYIIPFLIQFGLYVSPVGYSSDIISDRYPGPWRLLFSLNPVVGVIDGFRWCLLGGQSSIYVPGFCLSLAINLSLLYLGTRQFRLMERQFADLI